MSIQEDQLPNKTLDINISIPPVSGILEPYQVNLLSLYLKKAEFVAALLLNHRVNTRVSNLKTRFSEEQVQLLKESNLVSAEEPEVFQSQGVPEEGGQLDDIIQCYLSEVDQGPEEDKGQIDMISISDSLEDEKPDSGTRLQLTVCLQGASLRVLTSDNMDSLNSHQRVFQENKYCPHVPASHFLLLLKPSVLHHHSPGSTVLSVRDLSLYYYDLVSTPDKLDCSDHACFESLQDSLNDSFLQPHEVQSTLQVFRLSGQ